MSSNSSACPHTVRTRILGTSAAARIASIFDKCTQLKSLGEATPIPSNACSYCITITNFHPSVKAQLTLSGFVTPAFVILYYFIYVCMYNIYIVNYLFSVFPH